jgi:hypothetical protein
MVKHYGLKSPQRIMCNTPESGSYLIMFQPGSKYYFWNPIEGGIYEIVTSMDLVDIITEIDKRGLRPLKAVEVQ